MKPAYRLSVPSPVLFLMACFAAAGFLAGCAANSSKLAPGQKLAIEPGVMEGYQEFLRARSGGPGAFAVALSGDGYAYYYCPAQRCLGGRSAAAPRAIATCESHGATCVLFANDEGIIVPYEVVP